MIQKFVMFQKSRTHEISDEFFPAVEALLTKHILEADSTKISD